jgi:PAS domain-containing protein
LRRDHARRQRATAEPPHRSQTVGLRRPDDSVVWVSVSAVPLFAPHAPDSRRVVSTLIDISHHRQRERAHVARESQLLRVLDSAPFILWSADGRGRLSFLGGAAGLDVARRTALIGRPVCELFPDAEAFADHLRRALDGEALTVLVDSRSRVFERRLYPVRDPSGEIDGVSGISIDVTARVAAAAEEARLRDALRRAAEEWRTTFDAIDCPLLLVGPDDLVRRVNQATRRVWGQPFEKIVGSRLCEQEGTPWAAVCRAAAECRSGRQPVALQGATRTARAAGTSPRAWSANRRKRTAPCSCSPVTFRASSPFASCFAEVNGCR